MFWLKDIMNHVFIVNKGAKRLKYGRFLTPQRQKNRFQRLQYSFARFFGFSSANRFGTGSETGLVESGLEIRL